MQRSTTAISADTKNKILLGAKKDPLLWLRANSAQANLQSHPCFQSSLFNDKDRAAGSLKAWKEKYDPDRSSNLVTQSEGFNNRKNLNKDYQLENVIWTQSVKQPRRLTLNDAENITDWEVTLLKRQKSYAAAALGELKGKLEEKLNLDALHEMHMAFIEADSDGSGTLELDEFKEVVKNALKIQGRNEEEIGSLFMKINFNSDGKITWDEFCTFMQLNYSEKEEALRRQKEVVFITPSRTENNPHRSVIQKISSTGDGSFLVMSSDGIFSFWSTNGDLKRVRREIIEKRAVVKDKNDDSKRSRQKWMTDFIILTEFNKIVIGTGDRELQFWELSSFEPYCQVCALPTVPIKLAYCASGRDDVTLCYGDTDGCINIIIFSSIGETLRLWKTQPLIAQMPTIHLDKALESPTLKSYRWKSHNDWVEQIRIDRRMNQIISCSNDEQYAVIIGCILPTTDINLHFQQSSTQNLNIDSNQSSQQGAVNNSSTNQNNTQQTGFENIEKHASINSTTANNFLNSSLNSSMMDKSNANNAKRSNVNPSIDNQRTITPNTMQQQQQHKQEKHDQDQKHQQSKSIENIGSLGKTNELKRRPESNETVFKVNKGVKCFDFSFEKNLLITGD